MTTTQLPLSPAPVDMRIFTPIDILKTQLSRAYFCEKKQNLAECFDDCCALFRESRGVAPQHAFCSAETAAELGPSRHGITIAVGTWPKAREIYLIADEQSPA